MARDTFSDEEMAEFDVEFKKIDEKQSASFKNAVKLVETIEDDMKQKFGAVYRDRYEVLVTNRGY